MSDIKVKYTLACIKPGTEKSDMVLSAKIKMLGADMDDKSVLVIAVPAKHDWECVAAIEAFLQKKFS